MELLNNKFTLELSPGAFPLSTDSIALSGFVKLPRQAKVLDLGSGCGTLGLLLCAEHDACQVTGIELDPQAHQMTLHNAQVNGISSRLNSICANITATPHLIHAGSYSNCISNPPYFSSGPKSKTAPLARRDDLCTMEELFQAAAWALQFGGDFSLVHRPERLAELFVCASRYKLEPKRLCLLRHRPDSPVSVVLVQCRKGGKPGLLWEEVCLQDHQGQPTEYYRKLYHL